MQAATHAAAHTLSSWHPIDAVPSANPSDFVAEIDAERHALKRTYLRLLPHPQLVELCLAFEAYSTPHLKDSLWPYDLKAAVAARQAHQSAPPPPPAAAPVSTPHTPAQTSEDATSATPESSSEAEPAEPPLLGSLANNLPPERSFAQPQNGASNAPSPVAGALAVAISPSHAPRLQHPHLKPNPLIHINTDLLDPMRSRPPTLMRLTIHGDRIVWTSTHLLRASTPLAGFEAIDVDVPPPGTAQCPPGPGFPPHGTDPLPHPSSTSFTNAALTRMPRLPYYEDMIVEALAHLGDPEGCAPKAIYTWMASNYPLRSTFMTTATKALQRAHNRGRLEKSSNGKYRLNVKWNWDGPQHGRRPQAPSQIALGPQSADEKVRTPRDSPEPFQPQLPYPGTPYSHDAYPSFQPPASPAPPAEQQGAEPAEEVGEGVDAWEAAQCILKVIKFGSLLQSSDASGALEPVAGAAPDDALAFTVLSEQDRAAVQGQLSPLAAQRAEIADEALEGGSLGAENEDEDASVDVKIEDARLAVYVVSGGVKQEGETRALST
ncbi:hypothetical protein FA95DRAFT_1603548 [Auriscalpium vulgare]|uniref:Uncharacterized protein n=1 Tax=Auriscalpium vulgare TaxID=40419 RepID=A0ACB8S1M7_9AGAM|nr:hypothetical protein FA95DRAFT_1603548 [Auriscalpium vulgare]